MEVHGNLAMLLADQGRIDAAMAEYRAALGIAPSVVVLNNMGVLLVKTGRAAEAVSIYREALRLQPDAAPVHENLAYALLALGDRQTARVELERALQLDPGAEDARRALAELT